jgi:hypothetical protein
VCVVKQDGSGYELQATQHFDGTNWNFTAPLIIDPGVGGTAITIPRANVGTINQTDGFGVTSNHGYFDAWDTLLLGSSTDSGRGSIMTLMPINLFKRHVVWDFNEAVLPAGLTWATIGAGGASYSFTGESRISVLTGASSAGDGALLKANNTLTTLSRRSQIYFVLNLSIEDRNTDVQFGVRDTSSNNQVRFRYAAGSSAHSNITATVTNGAATSTYTTSYASVLDRRVYMVRWLPNGSIEFYCGDSNNVLQLCATNPASDSARPGSSVNLVPFIQFRTNDAAGVRRLDVDTVYAVFEW